MAFLSGVALRTVVTYILCTGVAQGRPTLHTPSSQIMPSGIATPDAGESYTEFRVATPCSSGFFDRPSDLLEAETLVTGVRDGATFCSTHDVNDAADVLAIDVPITQELEELVPAKRPETATSPVNSLLGVDGIEKHLSGTRNSDGSYDGESYPAWCDGEEGGETHNRRRGGYISIRALDSDSSNESSSRISDTVILAHAAMASLAFVVLFPIGGIIIRVASFPGLLWVHVFVQSLAYLLYAVAFGLGIWISSNKEYLSSTHPILGVVLFLVLLGQPIFGYVHHRLFKKYHRRTRWSKVHTGVGRAAILLGILNGGLGLQLARSTGSGVIAYSVVASVMGIGYLGVIVVAERRRRKKAGAAVPSTSSGGS